MGQRTLRVLEFNRILDMAAEGAQTPLGAEKCRDLKPYDNIADVIAAQAETEEAAVILQYIGASPMSSFPDVRPSLVICEKGASLSPAALLNIAALLKASSGMKSALVTERENTPVLRAKAEGLFEMRSLERDITDAIISEDEIADRASPALADIRRHLRGAREKIRERLNQMIRSSEMQKMLQEPVVTVRNDRYVIPVRAEYVNQVPGLVHDRSASGATLFVEPLAAVEAGNELKQWELKEREEIARILAELSAKVAPYAAELRENTEILTDLDFIFAKGQLSRRLYCVQPKLNDRGYIRIVRGRHPLIDPEKVVPLDLWLGTDFNTLVVTGPNTGGKTVTLKTTGLFTLMAQAGLQVPADPGTELAVFEQIFADIGDEQSIEQSLSTFSGHMTNIVTIMREVTPRDLVLFDELGAGTDPTEGAALAQSILTRLLHIRVRTIATTHYSELKVFAMTTEGVENASVEFNVETLRPTYRLSIGVPGKSNAFEISRRLGLPENLIDAAKNLLSGENIRFEDVIADAEYHRQVAEKERMLAQEASKETVRLRDEAEKLRKEMEERREQTLRKTREDARRILEQARRESEGILSDLKRLRKNAAAGNEGEAAALKKRLEHDIDEVSEGLKQAEDDSVAPDSVKAGDTVMILTLNAEGVVLAPADPKGDVQVQIGSMKMKAPLSALRIRKQEKPNAKTVVRAKTGTLTRTVSQECDVRGMMLDEAQTVVGLYLDEAVLAGLNEVSIIHGKGTGVLRAGIRQDLKKNKHVKSWRPGMYGEGEDGVTVVSLK
ncbi:MAG: endonuclease MutS2 [Clostridia bacterium]|nr:endonuclease MutS2 [Clostridia bacterium]